MVSSNDVTITEGQARVLRSRLRQAWVSGDCTAELDDAVRALDEQIENLDRRPRPRAAEGIPEDVKALVDKARDAAVFWSKYEKRLLMRDLADALEAAYSQKGADDDPR